VSLSRHRDPPSWPKPYFKVDPFKGGGSVLAETIKSGLVTFLQNIRSL
jgi:hypothetical protein